MSCMPCFPFQPSAQSARRNDERGAYPIVPKYGIIRAQSDLQEGSHGEDG